MVLVTTMLAAGAADGAFIYRASAATSGLRARLVAAPPQDSGVVVEAGGTPRDDPSGALDALVRNLPSAAQRIVGTSIQAYLTRPGKVDAPVDLLTSTDVCAQVHMVAGRCPTSGLGIALPATVASRLGWSVGRSVTIGQWAREPNGPLDTNILGVSIFHSTRPVPSLLRPLHLTVVGTYQVADPAAAYWMGSPPVTTFGPTQALSTTVIATPDDFAAIPHFTVAQVFVAQPLKASTILTSEVPALRHAIAVMSAIDPTGHVSVTTALPQLLSLDAADQTALGQVTLVSVAQLLALLALVLVVVLWVSSVARRTEVMAASIRGRHLIRVAADVAIEPTLLVLAGSVAGAALAPVGVRLASGGWLRGGTPVPLLPRDGELGVVAIAVGGVVGAVVIAVLATRRTSILPAATEPRSAAAWWEIAVFTVALGGLVELLTAGGIRSRTTPWALVSPSVCGLAVALLLARGLPPLLGPIVKRTRRTNRLSLYLLVRELRRDIVAWRVTAVVAMSVSLLAFAVAIDRGAVNDRQDRAGLIVGADRVVSVEVPSLKALPGIVDRLNPDGRWAMAAVQVNPLGSPDERTLAVDASRLPAVAGWSRRVGGLTPPQLAKVLEATPPAPYHFTGAALRRPVIDGAHDKVPISLTLRFALPGGARRVVQGPDLERGRHLYSWPTPGCATGSGCRLLSISVAKPPSREHLDLTIGGLGAGPWVADNVAAHHSSAGWQLAAGHYRSLLGTESLIRAEAPRAIPAILSPGQPLVVGVDSEQPRVRVAARAAALPRLLNDGSLVDLSYLLLADTGAKPGTTQVQAQVWLGDQAPPNAVARLEAMHVPVTSVSTRAREVAQLNALDPALGLDAYLEVSALAVLLALALLCGQGAVAARRRRSEYVALATAGVSRFSLGCGWFAAAVVRLGFCVGAGATAGLFVARLAASGVPLAARGTVPAPILHVQILPAVIAAIATLLPLVMAEAFSVRWSIRTVGLRRARETAA